MPIQIPAAREGFTFGCDPECFVFKNGKPVYPDMIPGTKAEPYKVTGGAIQRDGFAAEFNIDPANNFREFNGNIEKVLKRLESFLPTEEGYTLEFIPSTRFDKEEFDKAPDHAKELGCSPDFNAWDGDCVATPDLSHDPYFRSAGGHLHVGWTEGAREDDLQHIMNCRDLVRQFDWYLGGWSLKMDLDKERRKLYGYAGACRFKDYGVEYRTLSNFWVKSRDRRLAVWSRMQMAIDNIAVTSSCFHERVPKALNIELIEAINNSTELSQSLKSVCRYPLLTTETHYAVY